MCPRFRQHQEWQIKDGGQPQIATYSPCTHCVDKTSCQVRVACIQCQLITLKNGMPYNRGTLQHFGVSSRLLFRQQNENSLC